ncbi:MAG TPA: efflux RND transporter periplasmic adaptor subunit [Deferrisomatales bacterium]|nr:efflux RND transporter periplasmic adaptor subunit [Deferrisomatales bacterium]
MLRTVALLLGLLTLLPACGKQEESRLPVAPPSVSGVELETVATAGVEDTYEAVGTVRSRATTVLSSRMAGQVVAMHAREGDRVKAGHLLVEIDDREGQAQARRAEAGLREAEQALDEVERAIQAAESGVAAADANRDFATSTYDRFKALLERRSVSRQEFEEVEAKYKSAVAEAARAAEMRDSVKAKRNQVLARIDQARAEAASSQINLGYGRLTAPYAGLITEKRAEVGMLAAPGVPLLTLEDDSRYLLEVAVAESRVGAVHVGDPVEATIEALGSAPLSGRVAEIVPAPDPGSRSYTVKVDLKTDAAPAGLLRSGLYGKVRFAVGQRQVLLVPRGAVTARGQLVGVFIVDEQNVARLRLIKTGKEVGDRVEVLSGLSDGDRIAVSHIEALSDGAKVSL